LQILDAFLLNRRFSKGYTLSKIEIEIENLLKGDTTCLAERVGWYLYSDLDPLWVGDTPLFSLGKENLGIRSILGTLGVLNAQNHANTLFGAILNSFF
jgi:hypothetical protein